VAGGGELMMEGSVVRAIRSSRGLTSNSLFKRKKKKK